MNTCLYCVVCCVVLCIVSLISVDMLVQTGGRERSYEEYAQLLTAAGFTNVEYKKTGTYLDVIYAELK